MTLRRTVINPEGMIGIQQVKEITQSAHAPEMVNNSYLPVFERIKNVANALTTEQAESTYTQTQLQPKKIDRSTSGAKGHKTASLCKRLRGSCSKCSMHEGEVLEESL